MEEEVKYLYSVNPKRTIKLKGLLPLRTSKSLYLSKDQVKECLKYGSVYRRFANINRIERVVGNNVDRLHNAEFYTEEEWKQVSTNIKGKPDTVVEGAKSGNEPTPEEIIEEAPNKSEEESVIQEPVNESDVTEATDDETVSEDKVNVNTEEENEMFTQSTEEDQFVNSPDQPQKSNESIEGRRKKKRKH